MESFLVPIYFKLGNTNNEKLMGGLIMSTRKKIYVHSSSKRINTAGSIAGPAFSNLIKNQMDQIALTAANANKALVEPNSLFSKSESPFTPEYFDYLKKYSQNALLFGDIQWIEASVSEKDFEAYIQLYLNENPQAEKITKPNFHKKVKTRFKESGLDAKADIDLKLTPAVLPDLISAINVDLISKNGGILAAQGLDFTKSHESLVKSLNSYEVLFYSLNSFSKAKKLKDSKFYLLVNQPKLKSPQEALLNQIYASKKWLYTLTDSQEEVIEEIQKADYGKFTEAFSSLFP